GLDQIIRRTVLDFSPRPDALTDSKACFELRLEPREEIAIVIQVYCEEGTPADRKPSYEVAWSLEKHDRKQCRLQGTTVQTTNVQFSQWLNRATADLHMMITRTAQGPYPYAGVPWYSTAFRRDGIITAYECLWIDPPLARGVLAFLAATQAHDIRPEDDAEPGKTVHEIQQEEMAALRELPVGRYH